MRNTKTKVRSVIFLALGGLLAGAVLYGCATTEQTSSTTQPDGFALFGPAPKKSGVQLWSENCARCHNMRPPEEFSDAQWAAVVHHMRLRADLTGEESREIVKFLQASN